MLPSPPSKPFRPWENGEVPDSHARQDSGNLPPMDGSAIAVRPETLPAGVEREHAIAPLGPPDWRCVGVDQGRGSEWFYVFDVAGRRLLVRSLNITSPSTLLAIDPDVDRWRRMCPKARGRMGFDTWKIAGMLVRECWAAQVRKDEAAKVNAQTADANGSQLKSLEHKDD